MKTVDFLKIEELRDMGYTWDEVKNELSWFTDTDRKQYYGFKKGMELYEQRFSETRFTKREQNLRLERKVLGLERSVNNEQIRDMALHQTLSNQLKKALLDLPKLDIFEPEKVEEPTDKNYMFWMSDEHHDGDKDKFASILNISYSRIVEQIKEKGMERITLVIGGDVVEGAGNLRPSQAQAVRSGIIKQIMEASAMYADFLRELSKHAHLNVIIITSSNHTQLRLMGSKQNELVEEDLMAVFAQYLKGVLPDLHIVAEKQPTIKISGYICKLLHGHTVKKKSFEDELAEISSYENRLIDFLFLGHFHHYEEREISVGQGMRYDKKVFLMPALAQDKSNFEHDRKLSNVPGLGMIEFDNYGATAKKLPVVTRSVSF